jgi:hypothetical protein
MISFVRRLFRHPLRISFLAFARSKTTAKVLPSLIPALLQLWFKTRKRQQLVPFLGFAPLLVGEASLKENRSLLDIRQEFNLLELI